jgi:hypothetical protein
MSATSCLRLSAHDSFQAAGLLVLEHPLAFAVWYLFAIHHIRQISKPLLLSLKTKPHRHESH